MMAWAVWTSIVPLATDRWYWHDDVTDTSWLGHQPRPTSKAMLKMWLAGATLATCRQLDDHRQSVIVCENWQLWLNLIAAYLFNLGRARPPAMRIICRGLSARSACWLITDRRLASLSLIRTFGMLDICRSFLMMTSYNRHIVWSHHVKAKKSKKTNVTHIESFIIEKDNWLIIWTIRSYNVMFRSVTKVVIKSLSKHKFIGTM